MTAPLSGLSVTVVGIYFAPDTTGIAPYTTDLCQALAAAGADVHAVVGVPHYPRWEVAPGYRRRLLTRSTEDGVHVTRVRHFVPRRHNVLSRALYEMTFGLASALACLRSRPDVVIGVTPNLAGAVVAAALAQRRQVPLGLVVQDLTAAAAGQSGMPGGGRIAARLSAVEGRVLRAADRVGSISESFTEPLRRLGVDVDRIQQLPNYNRMPGTEFDRMQARATLGWPPDRRIVLHTGNMGLKQNLANVVRAARLAALEGHRDLLFILLGNGNDRAAVEREAVGLNNVRFVDPVSEEHYPLALAAADCLVLNERPSVRDMCLPSKLTSYFSAGRPVVAATALDGGAAQLIRSAGAGLVVPPGQPEALLAALLDSLDDPAMGAAQGRAARSYAQAHLSPSAGHTRLLSFATAVHRAPRQPGRKPASLAHVRVQGGPGAHVQSALLRTLARLSRPTGHRGIQRATWALAPYFDPGNQVTVGVGDRSRLRLTLDDGYWTKLLDPTFRYEPEIDWVLDRVLTPTSLFLDCGANIGFWSVRAAERTTAVIAVEANPASFRRLVDNLRLNDCATPVQAAVWRTTGDRLRISVDVRKHANASVVPDALGRPTGSRSVEVHSITIDDLVATHTARDAPVVIKLDVEGAEIAAVQGAERTLRDREVVLLYEDHGNDPTCAVTKHLMDLGLQIHGAGRTSPMTLAEIAAVKTDPTRGYNFAACVPSSRFAARLLSADR